MVAWTSLRSLAECADENLSLDDPLHLRVVGRVQGVGYRQWTVKAAQSLNLGGWVRNCSDGSVEILVTGATLDRRRLLRLCWDGPRLARVSAIHRLVPGLDGRSLPPAHINLMLQIDSV